MGGGFYEPGLSDNPKGYSGEPRSHGMAMEIEHPEGSTAQSGWVEAVPAALPRTGGTPTGSGETPSARSVTLVSFGFKYGQPAANHVFDVSFLKNPARQEGWTLWSEPGEAMRSWVIEQPDACAFIDAVLPLIQVLSNVDDDARIAFGCSAGRHRSAILVEEVARLLREDGIEVAIHHRERAGAAQLAP